ncbi:MAG: adenine phosphoribosyltransferase [Chrysothrix sp. TS-e1954]|nr:MAG: adenine phosphoribosyltransferase [Chrysothrix sp. TS-e1954]
MSGQPVSTDSHPPHGHPDNIHPSTQAADKSSTASHPPSLKPDPTTSGSQPSIASKHAAQGRQPASDAASASKLSGLKKNLHSALKQYPDFPSPGVLFEDILPIFADYKLHDSLLEALELHINESFGESQKPDVIVGLDARGFLFGPSLALRLGAGFVPVRKQGKLPGRTETVSYKKEYGEDHFQLQSDSIRPGQRVLVVDDIIATGGSAAATGELVQRAGGNLLGYVFILELDFLKGRKKLNAPVYTLLSSQQQD